MMTDWESKRKSGTIFINEGWQEVNTVLDIARHHSDTYNDRVILGGRWSWKLYNGHAFFPVYASGHDYF